METEYEYDEAKSAANLDKHGIDFATAQAVWSDEDLLIQPSNYPFEDRWLAIGQIGSRFWTVVFTFRGAKRRIISARRSRKVEIGDYGANQS